MTPEERALFDSLPPDVRRLALAGYYRDKELAVRVNVPVTVRQYINGRLIESKRRSRMDRLRRRVRRWFR